MHYNWLTDHAIDYSSFGLKRLTMQLVFNKVSLFKFSKRTHGFDVTVPKNYHKILKLMSSKVWDRTVFILQNMI